jgi:hypothetical protein
MPLNKLENFIKNTEGRILYVNPNDLDATDGIDNQGNSLTKPFKTIQRALIESARFSYLRGSDNDITEKTTILAFPGEHLIDNRPGYAIKDVGGTATAVAPNGSESFAGNELTLTLNSNFDLTQENNILFKFNSIYGGIIIPRGTSIVGLDLRKTKVRPKYVPNPTDPNVQNSAIFRITGACYFWQFTFFDGDEFGLVYTDPVDFSSNNKSVPIFSHHKLTCFEYADGVNIPSGYAITDLDMYYSKLSNAFNRASGREIDEKFPALQGSFTKKRPEWEIVGAFASDPIAINNIISGDGATPGAQVTVTTQLDHNLSAGTPIKIKGINVNDYNISTKVTNVISDKVFTYSLPSVRANLPAGPGAGLAPGSNASATIETDTVSGASPYIFNVSLRSVFGMQGMHTDGSKASGFRSMVVAQFTAVSLQKDDRAFVKYNRTNRTYDSISVSKVSGDDLSAGASSINQDTVYHLDSNAIYRTGWKSAHIKMSNDAVVQIVSVFAIGFHKHFEALSGGDASITNSNSNFGQFSLAADGFKSAAFTKDDKGFVTSIIAPRSISSVDSNIEWVQFDAAKTIAVAKPRHLYLLGYTNQDIAPPIISQGYRIGAAINEKLYVDSSTHEGAVLMTNGPVTAGSPTISGSQSSVKSYSATLDNNTLGTIYTIGAHTIQNGESIRIFSETGDLPENIEENVLYYAITNTKKTTLNSNQIQLSSSRTNAEAQNPIFITSYGGQQLKIESRVSDKIAGELGSPIQWDVNQNQWFVHVGLKPDSTPSALYTYILTLTTPESEISFFHRKEDNRSLDEKLYKLRYVVPKELVNGRDPASGFILQDSNSTNVRSDSDFTISSINNDDYDFNRNTRFISTCTFDSGSSTITIRSDKVHNLRLGDKVVVDSVTSTTNTDGSKNLGYNGTFIVEGITNDKTFTLDSTDIFGTTHNPGLITNNTHVASNALPRFSRNDCQRNLYIYRVEVITSYIENVQDGVYYLYVSNYDNAVPVEFTDIKYSQNITNLYPQQDRDNPDDNPPAAKTFAKRFPLGEVLTSDVKRSLTRESLDMYNETFSNGIKITGVSDGGTSATLTFDREHQLGGVKVYQTLVGGSGYNNGTYRNVKLFNDTGLSIWNGATANVTVSGGAVTAATIVESGSAYSSVGTLYFDTSVIGGTPNAGVTINATGISTAEGNYVQVTGIGTATGGYFRIGSTINVKNQIGIAKTVGDPTSVAGQYVINLGPAVTISQSSYDTVTGISTFNSLSSPHGLLAGNAITILDNSNNNLGNYIVNAVNTPTQFTSKTNITLSGSRFVLKHGLSANNAPGDNLGENLGIRGLGIYDNELLILGQTLTTAEQFAVSLPGGASGVIARFPLGSYLQIDNEIMRVRSNSLTGTSSNEIQVIRGSMGTIIESHTNGSLIKKIRLNPIEFRRPSILRASGHTFEYLGYGPGNYSTGLPQVQLKTLTDSEEFLSQAQETACGTVLYTGMDSDGDFYIGNTKYSSQSGEQTTFDVPKPSITGEDPNRLSVVFDEVIVKERILVEGGNSGQILSQFDGPVTFNADVRMTRPLILNNNLRVVGTVDFRNANDATSCTDANASLRVAGGVGIAKRLYVCGATALSSTLGVTGATTLSSTLTVTGGTTLTGLLDANGGATIDNIRIGIANNNEIDTSSGNLTIDSAGGTTTIDDILIVSGATTLSSTLGVTGATTLSSTLGVTGATTLTGLLTVNNNITAGANTITASTFAGNATSASTAANLSFGSANQVVFKNGSNNGATSSNLTFNGTNLGCAGDITAFASDERLKENIQPLENALNKVLALSGFTYTFNEIGESLGFDTTITYVGVSAQQVQAVLPEAVKPAPANEDYLTVQYEKIVPLLIEAIKELTNKVSNLEDKLNQINN